MVSKMVMPTHNKELALYLMEELMELSRYLKEKFEEYFDFISVPPEDDDFPFPAYEITDDYLRSRRKRSS